MVILVNGFVSICYINIRTSVNASVMKKFHAIFPNIIGFNLGILHLSRLCEWDWRFSNTSIFHYVILWKMKIGRVNLKDEAGFQVDLVPGKLE